MSEAQQVAILAIEDTIRERARALPAEKKQEVLDFVEFLAQRTKPKKPRKSFRGLWADLKSDVTKEDIDEMRREAWKNFPREFPQ